VLDDMTLLLRPPVAGCYGDDIAGAERVVRIVDEESFGVIEELYWKQGSAVSKNKPLA
jgi:hypothetical protein